MTGTIQLTRPARWQFLGNGHRVYNPVLMRFHSPDSLSPFGRGGRNAYAYCAGDPINHADPSGRFAVPLIAGLLATAGTAAVASQAQKHGGEEAAVWLVAGVVALAAIGGGVGMLRGVGRGASRPQPPSLGVGPARAPSGLNPAAAEFVPGGSSPRSALNPNAAEFPMPAGMAQAPTVAAGQPLPTISYHNLPPTAQLRIGQVRTFKTFGSPEGRFYLNIEGRLPAHRSPRFYREYTVATPGNPGKGGMRLITGGLDRRNPAHFFFSPDHHISYFRVQFP